MYRPVPLCDIFQVVCTGTYYIIVHFGTGRYVPVRTDMYQVYRIPDSDVGRSEQSFSIRIVVTGPVIVRQFRGSDCIQVGRPSLRALHFLLIRLTRHHRLSDTWHGEQRRRRRWKRHAAAAARAVAMAVVSSRQGRVATVAGVVAARAATVTGTVTVASRSSPPSVAVASFNIWKPDPLDNFPIFVYLEIY